MDKIAEMSSFVAVVESGSFVAAAESCNRSKAAISRLVSDLERRLDVRLLQRTTRRLSLTEEGRLFYARAKELLAALEEAESEIGNRSANPSGLLRINAPVSFGISHLAPLWPQFCAQHPRVQLEITLSDRQVDLIEEGFDLVVRISDLPSSQLISRRLASTRLILCASPGYLRTNGAPSHPSELSAHRVIGYSYFASRDEWQFERDGDPVRVRTRPIFYSNNGDTCRAAAMAGHGIVLQPDFIVGADLARGALVELIPDFRARQIGIHALYASRKQLPLKVRLMVDFLADQLATPSWPQPAHERGRTAG
ncbi:MAG: LysR family transcriptional regulator [Xanthomonadales bacterium]|nr:LysR family transcriptional regulator [Xanthomonadales bacterium]